jgi:hypothetical protein
LKVKEYIEKIIQKNKKEDMEKLSDMLEDLIYKMKEYDEECYHKYKMKLYGMANDYKFDKEYAIELVEDMRPIGEMWSIDTTNKVKSQYGINASDYDFYIVLNSLANDYGKIISTEDVETYVKMANAFINDVDAKENKVWRYYTTIVEN